VDLVAASLADLPGVKILLPVVRANGPPAVRRVQELDPDPEETNQVQLPNYLIIQLVPS